MAVLGFRTQVQFMGCYRPPSTSSEALSSLNNRVSELNSSEFVIVGDLNLDWLSSASDGLKSICDSLNLSQLIDSPTRPNIKYPSRSSLLDVIITNAHHRYTDVGVFGNDLSDHCAIAVVRNAKLPKTKLRILLKGDFKLLHEHAFLHDLLSGNIFPSFMMLSWPGISFIQNS